METYDIYQLLFFLAKTVFFSVLYMSTYIGIKKIFSRKITKAIVIGLFTPFCFYYLITNLVYFIGYIFFWLELKDLGTSILLIAFVVKPVSIIIGIAITIFLLDEKKKS